MTLPFSPRYYRLYDTTFTNALPKEWLTGNTITCNSLDEAYDYSW